MLRREQLITFSADEDGAWPFSRVEKKFEKCCPVRDVCCKSEIQSIFHCMYIKFCEICTYFYFFCNDRLYIYVYRFEYDNAFDILLIHGPTISTSTNIVVRDDYK